MARAGFLYLFGISCVLAVLQIDAKLTQAPSNELAYLNDSVIFRCFTENKDYPPSWYHTKVGSTEARDVYTIVRNGKGIVGRMTQEYHERMEVLENRTTGEYSLRIKSVQSDDAGQYRCTARGGLGQSDSAELTIIKPPIQCHTNASELLGEHVCDHGPDNVKISCSFEVTGNSLPKVSWVKTDNMSEVIITETVRWSKEPGHAASSLILSAEEAGLDGSSFMCLVYEPNSISTDRLSCTTDTLHVIKLKHVFGTRTLEGPAEVPCPQIPHVTETGFKWIKRSPEESGSVIIVTKERTLNLYKPEMIPGDYACMIDCNIGNKECEVEALTVNYQNNGTAATEPPTGLNEKATLIIITVVVTVVVCIVIAVVSYFVASKFGKSPNSPTQSMTSTSTELSNVTRSSQEQLQKSNGALNRDASPAPSIKSIDSAVRNRKESIPNGANAAAVEQSNNGTGEEQAERESLMGSSSDTCNAGDVVDNISSGGSSDHSVYDIPDAKIGKPGDRANRLSLVEERARARMQMNAELRQGKSSPESGDVAEGLRPNFNTDKKDL